MTHIDWHCVIQVFVQLFYQESSSSGQMSMLCLGLDNKQIIWFIISQILSLLIIITNTSIDWCWKHQYFLVHLSWCTVHCGMMLMMDQAQCLLLLLLLTDVDHTTTADSDWQINHKYLTLLSHLCICLHIHCSYSAGF